MKGKMLIVLFFLGVSVYAFGQWENGVILDIQDVDIGKMKSSGMRGADAVLMVMEQFIDQSYRYMYISSVYSVGKDREKYPRDKSESFTVGIIGYPEMNNLIYAQVLYDEKYFIMAAVKDFEDMKVMDNVRVIRLNYEKRNQLRRDNVRETLQRNNIIPMGIEGR